MRVPRLFAAPTTVALVSAMFTVAPASAAPSAQVHPGCPEGTVGTQVLGHDDFEPSTPEKLPWVFEPADSWAESSAQVDRSLWASTPTEAGATKAAITSGIQLPANKTTVVGFIHGHNFGDPAAASPDRGVVEIGVGGQWTELASLTGLSGGPTSGDYPLTQYAGQEVSFRWRIIAGAQPSEGGWALYDVGVVTCEDGYPPLQPGSVTATGGLGTATVKWTAPPSGSEPATGYTVTVSPGGATYEVGANARSQRVTGLASGRTYTFSVTARNDHGASNPRSRKLIGTKIYSSAPSYITYGRSAKVSGKLARVDNGAGLYNHSVKLQGRKKGSTGWGTIKYARTGSGGAYSFTSAPSSNYEYRVVYSSGNGSYLGSTSATRVVNVRTKVSGAWSDSSIRVGQVSRFGGSVYPNHRWQRVELQVYYQGRWHSDPELVTKLNGDSKYAFYLQFNKAGTYLFRAYKPADRDHAAGYSPGRKIVVS